MQLMKYKKWIAVIAIVLLIAIPVAAKKLRTDDSKAVDAEAVEMRVLAPSILASGTLVYESERKLVSEVIGRVKDVLVREGDQVKEGQVMLRLDQAASMAEIGRLDAARAQSELNIQRQGLNLRTQEAKWKRYQSLRSQGIVDANTYEEIETQRDLAEVELNTSRAMLRQTEAQMKEARERLAKTEIRSPISGTVTAVFIEAGETAVPSATSIAGSDLMIVADTASLYAEVNVDETDVARVGVGQAAKIVPAAFPDKAWNGTVEQVAISPRQNTGQSKNYPVKIRLAAADDMQFHPGMSCRAEISTRRENASKSIAVPVQAVRYEESDDKDAKAKASVFVIVDGKAKKRPVETGTADDIYIEIRQGLKEKETIVTGPAKTLRFLQDGERVAATNATAAASEPADAVPASTQ
jgi:HlyD family secretion protein